MTVMVDMENTGDPSLKGDVVASVEHALADRRGDWRVSIIGSQANDRWEMKIFGPNAFERSYTLEGSRGEHRQERIRTILGMLVPCASPKFCPALKSTACTLSLAAVSAMTVAH